MNPQVEAQAKPVVTPQATGAPALPKATQESQKPATNLQGDAKKEQDGKQVQPTPVPDYKSKIDSSLFDIEESLEDNVKILKLTIKEGTSTNRLQQITYPVRTGLLYVRYWFLHPCRHYSFL